MLANKRYTNSEFLEFWQSKISEMSTESKMRYRKTLAELDIFLTGHHLQLADLSATMIADWTTEMLSRGLAKGTVTNHLNFFSGLLKSAVKEGMLGSNDTPRTLSKSLAELKTDMPVLLKGTNYNACLSILRNALKRTKDFNVFEDIVLFSMINGAIPIEEIVSLKVSDSSKYYGISQMIIERNLNKKRNYIFDLRQSYLTSKQLKTAVAEGVFSVFKRLVESESFDADDFIRSLWVAIAIRSGLLSSETLGCVGGSAPYAVLPFNEAVEFPPEGKKWWINTVNTILSHKMPCWYAMHLRRGVKFDEVRKEIYEKFQPIPEFFYPCETFVKQTKNRKVIDEQPYITSTVFFKIFPPSVQSLFNVIGEKAWCYRTLGVPSAPYAVIPQRDMERFQKAIGIFTPDMEIKPLGELAPKPGESVIVVSAGFGSRTGKVEEVINKDSESVIFRVKLDTDNGYEFRVDLDERQIERIIA